MPRGVKAMRRSRPDRGRPIQPVVVQRGQGDAGDRGRQSERQVDQRIDETPAWKPVAHEDPRDEDTEDGVDESGEERGSEADAERRERARV
jgi:hypothetical protein